LRLEKSFFFLTERKAGTWNYSNKEEETREIIVDRYAEFASIGLFGA
jgi:hypothetical protein